MSQETKQKSQKIYLEVTQDEIDKAKILEKYLRKCHIVNTKQDKQHVEIEKYTVEGKNYLFFKFHPYTTFGWHDMKNLEQYGFGFLNISIGLGINDVDITLDLHGDKMK